MTYSPIVHYCNNNVPEAVTEERLICEVANFAIVLKNSPNFENKCSFGILELNAVQKQPQHHAKSHIDHMRLSVFMPLVSGVTLPNQ